MQKTPELLCLVAAAAATCLLAACATTQMDAQWTNPEYSGRNVRGASVLVACEAQDLTLQRICEDQLAAAVSARGATPTLNSQLKPDGATSGSDPYLAAAKRVGARAIIRMTLSAGQVVAVNSGPSVGFGIGGGSGRSGAAGGISFPIGGGRVSQPFASEAALIDSSNGATMWSGRASSSTSDLTAQVTELTQTTVQALQSSGLL